jgi:hypothetical protein
MGKHKNYFEHPGRVVEADNQFSHVMAITLDPTSDNKDGVIRCITSRTGDVAVSGFIDRSELHRISGESLECFKVGERVKMKDEGQIIFEIGGNEFDFLGLEDPDIYIDEKTGLTHLYFTMPFYHKTKKHTYLICLGHAVGKNLDSLEMTKPVLLPTEENDFENAKEVSIVSENSEGVRHNLIESSRTEDDVYYSTVRVATARDMGEPWEFGDTVFHPKEHNIPWIAGHASPGPMLPKSFIDIGEGKMLGIINGREANQIIDKKIVYGMFSIGLFIYDYENGKIDWVSPEPLIIDSEARTITFASQFVPTGDGEGILYAHVDDSFVRAYTLKAEDIKTLLPK